MYHLLKRRRKTLSEDAARLISSEVILALESMHAKGCVYRDLKPDNVLLDSEGTAVCLFLIISHLAVLDIVGCYGLL